MQIKAFCTYLHKYMHDRCSDPFHLNAFTDLRETPTCINIRTNQFLHRSRKTQTIDEVFAQLDFYFYFLFFCKICLLFCV